MRVTACTWCLVALMVSPSTAMDAAAEATSRPVSKVVTLLKDMLKQMEKEADEDQEIFDKMGCWCVTNDKEKTKSIADAESHIGVLTTHIEEYSAMSARYSTEIKNLERDLAKNQNGLSTAIANRKQQLAEFNAEEKDALESISALKSALLVLKGPNSFLQVSHSQIKDVVGTLQREMQNHASLLEGMLTPEAQRMATAFIQSPSYAPQSGAIFGILSQMKETFEANLAVTQKDEAKNQKAFEELKAAKEAEIAAGQAQIDDKTQELADTNEKNANAKADMVETKATLAADQEFLMMLKEKCQLTNKEFEERLKTRGLEMTAVAKALEMLNGDASHDLFSRTFNPAFVQTGIAVSSKRRQQASKLLSALGSKSHNPRIAAVALQVNLDAFTEVKKAIDELMASLKKEGADEITHRDFCVSEFNSNEKQTTKKTREKQDAVGKIEDLSMTLQQLTSAIEGLNAEIEEMETQLKRAGDDRDKQNQEFQMTVADQRESAKLLRAALKVLEGFYGKAAFAQQEESAGPPPPPGFSGGGSPKKSGASGDVMGMIQQIIDDSKAMEADAVRADAEAQAAYEDFVKETTTSIEVKNKDIRSKNEVKAATEQDLGETEQSKEALMLELEQLSNYNTQLHADCDFVIKNFDIRQSARAEEIEGLRQATAILSGSGGLGGGATGL